MKVPSRRFVSLAALVSLGAAGLLGAAPEAEAEVRALRAATEVVNQQIKELQVSIRQARIDLETLEEEFNRYREDYRTLARLQVMGDQFDTLDCLDGREFKDVTIRQVDAIGLSIRHRDGVTRIDYTALPRELQERFQWTSHEAGLARAEEAERQAEYTRLTRIAYQRMEERREKAAEEARAADERLLLARRSAPAPVSAASSSRLSSLGRLGERRTVGSGSYRDRYSRYDDRYHSRYYRRPTTYYYCPTNYRSPSRVCPPSRPTPAQQQRRVWSKIPSRSTITPVRVPGRSAC